MFSSCCWHLQFLPLNFLLFLISIIPVIKAMEEKILLSATIFAHISDISWQRWKRFKVETCRQNNNDDREDGIGIIVNGDDYMAETTLNSTEHDYFHWEQGEFHRQLRRRILPETIGHNLQSLIGSPLLHSRLDPRLFASEPKSLCQKSQKSQESLDQERRRMVEDERILFEDSIIGRVFPQGDDDEEYDY